MGTCMSGGATVNSTIEQTPKRTHFSRHDHCRAITGKYDHSAKFTTEADALAFAVAHNYKVITRRQNGKTYYLGKTPSQALRLRNLNVNLDGIMFHILFRI
jgi:hypothetical protein